VSGRGWETGDVLVVRDVYRERVWAGRPYIVVRDTPSLVALYIPTGTNCRRAIGSDGAFLQIPRFDWDLGDFVTGNTVLRLWTPAASHSCFAWWEADGTFLGWYVNLEEPWRRAAVGFDSRDYILDLILWANGQHEWKDAEQLEEAVQAGVVTRTEADAAWAEGRRVLQRARTGASPFSDGWEQWRPDPTWRAPELVPGWDRV
jgi:Protein of unknown function (DUF402)